MPNLNFEIPEEIHKKFKIKCIEIEKDMQDVLIDFMDKFSKKGSD